MDDDQLLDALATWLSGPLGERPTLTAQGKPGSGYSSETLIVNASTSAGEQRLVLRRDGADDPIYPSQAPGLTTGVGFQRMVMGALDGAVPLARVLGERDRPERAGCAVLRDGVRRRAGADRGPAVHARGLLRRRVTRGADDDDHRRAARAGTTCTTSPWRGTDLEVLDPSGTTPGARRQREIWVGSLQDGARRPHQPGHRRRDHVPRGAAARRPGARRRTPLVGRRPARQHDLGRVDVRVPVRHRLRGRGAGGDRARPRVVADGGPVDARGVRSGAAARRADARRAARDLRAGVRPDRGGRPAGTRCSPRCGSRRRRCSS